MLDGLGTDGSSGVPSQQYNLPGLALIEKGIDFLTNWLLPTLSHLMAILTLLKKQLYKTSLYETVTLMEKKIHVTSQCLKAQDILKTSLRRVLNVMNVSKTSLKLLVFIGQKSSKNLCSCKGVLLFRKLVSIIIPIICEY